MEAISEEYTRLNKIIHSNTPVTETSSIYNSFLMRKKLAEKLYRETLTEENRKILLKQFNYIETQIKDYLLL